MSTGKNHEAQIQRRKAPRQKPVYDQLSNCDESLVTLGNNNRVSLSSAAFNYFSAFPELSFICRQGRMAVDHASRFNALVSDFLKDNLTSTSTQQAQTAQGSTGLIKVQTIQWREQLKIAER